MYGKGTERIEVFGSQRNKKGKICPGQHRDENILGRQISHKSLLHSKITTYYFERKREGGKKGVWKVERRGGREERAGEKEGEWKEGGGNL